MRRLYRRFLVLQASRLPEMQPGRPHHNSLDDDPVMITNAIEYQKAEEELHDLEKRLEVLRQQLFRECFFEGRPDEEKQLWSARLNELFALECKIHVRLSLVVVAPFGRRSSAAACPAALFSV